MKNTISDLRTFFNSEETFALPWRKTQLRAIIRMLDEQTDSITQALTNDLGKPRQEAWITEIGFVKAEARHALKHIDTWVRPNRVPSPIFLQPAASQIRPQPRGLALIISPWNYPVQLTLSPLVAAICAGNVAIIKPSELAPAVAAWCSHHIPKYLDPRAFAVIEAGPEKTAELLKEPFDIIFFTGSTKTALHIARAAAEHLTPTVLELGGKSPCVVTNCKHLQTAARRIAFAKFTNAGQTCVAPDYILVQEYLKSSLIDELKKAIVKQFGPENDPTDYTHIIHKGHFERLRGMLGTDESVVFGGVCQENTLTIAPTLIETGPEHPSMQEEIFGPILPILTLPNDNPVQEAKRIIAQHPTPLACYLFSDNKKDLESFSRVIAGGLTYYGALMHLSNVNLPFGGVGTSGHGSSHGYAGFQAFSHMRAELLQSPSFDLSLKYPPYTDRKMGWIKRFMK